MRKTIGIAAAALWVLAAAPPAQAQSAFGSASQDLVIPAQAFKSMTPGVTLAYAVDGYAVLSPLFSTGWVSTPIELEAGARITALDCDFHTHVALEAHVHLRRRVQPPGNVPPILDDILHIHTPTGSAFYRQIGGVLDHTVQSRLGGVQRAYYVLDIEMENDGTDELRLLGCRLTWNRQVSPAPSTATFGDVPTTHPQYRFVEALVAAGITGGCGAAAYCPDAPLTRGQMAVFLSVALGLHFPF